MVSRIDCALNGVSLAGLDGRICVADVTEAAPEERAVTARHPALGTRIIRKSREKLTVQVRIRILEEDVITRRALWQHVRNWAVKGGILTVTDRPGMQLAVVCEGLPALSALCWQEEMALTFAAYGCPYWEDAVPTVVSTTSAAAVTLPGAGAHAPVSVTLTNTGSAAVTQVTLTAGETAMTFEGLSLPAGGQLILTVQDGLLAARVNGASVLHGRTADSDDLLLLPCGEASTVAVSAAGPVSAVFEARGRYA